MVSNSYWLRTQPSWLLLSEASVLVFLCPFSLVENSTYESVSSSASPQFLCQSSIHWYRFSHWLKSQRMRVWAPLLWQSLVLVSFLHQLVPQLSLVPSSESSILIGWKLNQWELELLSSAFDQVSIFSIHWYCSLVENSAYESVRSSANPQFHISDSIHWCAILIGWKLTY